MIPERRKIDKVSPTITQLSAWKQFLNLNAGRGTLAKYNSQGSWHDWDLQNKGSERMVLHRQKGTEIPHLPHPGLSLQLRYVPLTRIKPFSPQIDILNIELNQLGPNHFHLFSRWLNVSCYTNNPLYQNIFNRPLSCTFSVMIVECQEISKYL